MQIRTNRWDLVILDISMPGRSGLDALKEVRTALPRTPILVLSMHPAEHYAIRVLRGGARGYLSKSAATTHLIAAVERTLAGGVYIPPGLEEKLVSEIVVGKSAQPDAALSDREFEVLRMLAGGLGNKESAAQLSLSPQAISTYRSRLLTKLGLRSSGELVRYAIDHKLVDCC